MEKIHYKLILHYLRILHEQLENASLNEVQGIVSREVPRRYLMDILNKMFGNQIPEEYDIENSSNEELVEIINDDVFVIEYLIDKLDSDIGNTKEIIYEDLWSVLEQLGLETHYLGHKPIEEWDKYDHSNYNSLKQKVGK